MQARDLAQERGSEDCACGDASSSRFRRAIAALEESWAAEARRSPFYPFVTWTREGPRIGAATLLTRKGTGEDERLLALLSIAYGFAVPANALKHLAWAETEFDRGDLAKSAMHVALTGLPALVRSEAARRLHIAAGILDHGFLTPLGLIKACEFDCGPLESLVKYNPDEPRVAAGNPGGGQWTSSGDAAGPSRSTDRSARTSESTEVAVLTNNLRYACRALGLDYNAASDILHALKEGAGLSGADQCTFDTETGDVFYGDEYIGNLVQ
jgi:hypothetical protein